MSSFIFESLDDLRFYAQSYSELQSWVGPQAQWCQRMGSDSESHLHIWMMESFFENNAHIPQVAVINAESISLAAKACAEEYNTRPAALGMLFAWYKGVEYTPPHCVGVQVALDANNTPKHVDVLHQDMRVRYLRPNN